MVIKWKWQVAQEITIFLSLCNFPWHILTVIKSPVWRIDLVLISTCFSFIWAHSLEEGTKQQNSWNGLEFDWHEISLPPTSVPHAGRGLHSQTQGQNPNTPQLRFPLTPSTATWHVLCLVLNLFLPCPKSVWWGYGFTKEHESAGGFAQAGSTINDFGVNPNGS